MKKITLIFASCFLYLALAAQSGYVHVSNQYGYQDNHNYSDRYNDNDYYNGYNDRVRRSRYSQWYPYLSNRDSKKLRKLERKLLDRERCALEDGYISRKEQRRIYDVEKDIDCILDKYRSSFRGNRYSNNRGSRFTQRYRGVCR